MCPYFSLVKFIYFSSRWRHVIANLLFCKSLGFAYFVIKFPDSRHVQLAIYKVFHEESESAVRIDQFLHQEEKIKTTAYDSLDFLS